jgi:hypothetical protein
VVQAETSAYIALAYATADWQHGGTQCLSRRDLTGYDFLSVSNKGYDFRSSAQECSVPMSAQKNVEWLRHRMEQYRSTTNDICEAIKDFDKVEKLGQSFSSANPLEEIDIADGITSRPTFANKNMSLEHKDAIIKVLRDYIDCFIWNYHEMPDLS